MDIEFYQIETPVWLTGRRGCLISKVASVVRIRRVHTILRLMTINKKNGYIFYSFCQNNEFIIFVNAIFVSKINIVYIYVIFVFTLKMLATFSRNNVGSS